MGYGPGNRILTEKIPLRRFRAARGFAFYQSLYGPKRPAVGYSARTVTSFVPGTLPMLSEMET